MDKKIFSFYMFYLRAKNQTTGQFLNAQVENSWLQNRIMRIVAWVFTLRSTTPRIDFQEVH